MKYIYIYIYNVLYWHKVSGSVLHVAYGIVLHRNRHWHYVKIVAH